MTDRRPIADVLPGVAITELPDGFLPAEAFVLVKCVDSEGDTHWAVKTTEHFNREEFLGTLTVYLDVIKREMAEDWLDG